MTYTITYKDSRAMSGWNSWNVNEESLARRITTLQEEGCQILKIEILEKSLVEVKFQKFL